MVREAESNHAPPYLRVLAESGQLGISLALTWNIFISTVKCSKLDSRFIFVADKTQKNIMLEILGTSCIKGVKNEACLHQHICGEYTHGQFQVNKSLHTPFL